MCLYVSVCLYSLCFFVCGVESFIYCVSLFRFNFYRSVCSFNYSREFITTHELGYVGRTNELSGELETRGRCKASWYACASTPDPNGGSCAIEYNWETAIDTFLWHGSPDKPPDLSTDPIGHATSFILLSDERNRFVVDRQTCYHLTKNVYHFLINILILTVIIQNHMLISQFDWNEFHYVNFH